MSTVPELCERRNKLMLNFALKCLDNSRTYRIFTRNEIKTGQTEVFKVPHARTDRYKKSAIPTMARLLNQSKINTNI